MPVWWVGVALAMDVEVVEDVRHGRWTVTWTTEAPARGVVFARNRNPIQADFDARPGRVVSLGDHLALVLPGDRTDTTFRATFRTETVDQPKDYELNVAFGDGARLLYTDHLFVLPLSCPGEGPCAVDNLEAGAATVHDFRFVTDPARHVLTPDGRSRGGGAWSQRSGGVYVYFGDGEPLPDERVHFLLDPTLPPWVVARSRDWIGPLFDRYTAQTGRALSFRPMVLLSYERGAEGETGYGGGGLPGQMQLRLSGRAWAGEGPENLERYARFLAHETFHMWNGEELDTRVDASEEWLSEGSAELFSLWALEHLGLLDATAVQGRVLEAASRCASDLGSAPLLTAHQRGNYRAFYSCGATGLAQLHHTLAPSGGLAPVFAAMFAEGDTYSTYTLLEHAHLRSGDPLATAFLERLLRLGLGADPLTTLSDALSAAGVPNRAVDTWTVDGLDVHTHHDALVTTIGACDCGGSVSVWNRGERLDFDPLEACDQLRTGLGVTTLAGGPTLPRREALRRAWAEIDATGTLTLGGGGETRVLRCEGVARPRVLVPG